jgi:hypothetical protein
MSARAHTTTSLRPSLLPIYTHTTRLRPAHGRSSSSSPRQFFFLCVCDCVCLSELRVQCGGGEQTVLEKQGTCSSTRPVGVAPRAAAAGRWSGVCWLHARGGSSHAARALLLQHVFSPPSSSSVRRPAVQCSRALQVYNTSRWEGVEEGSSVAVGHRPAACGG